MLRKGWVTITVFSTILSRFAEHQFKKQSDDIKKEFFTLAFEYNEFVMGVLRDNRFFKKASSLKALDMHFNNFLKVLDFITIVEKEKEDLLDFIEDLSYLFTLTHQPEQFLIRVRSLKDFFAEVKNGELLLEILELNVIYWVENFERPFSRLLELMPFEKLSELDITKQVDKNILINSVAIYECEGYTFDIVKLAIERDIYFIHLDHRLFKLGFLEEALSVVERCRKEDDFSILEIKNCNNIIGESYILNHLKQLYKKQALEIVQCTYVYSKIKDIDEGILKKLVVSNPYTRGLISLMSIPFTQDVNKKRELFESAIRDLEHIKYYYVEAILSYCRFLQRNNFDDYKEWYSKGLEIAQRFKLGFLIWQFENITEDAGTSEYEGINYAHKVCDFDGKLSLYVEEFIRINSRSK